MQVLLLVGAAAAAPPLRSMEWSHLSNEALRAPPVRSGPAPRYFTTLQDHFNASNKKTWQQAYFVNDTQFDGTGPIFLCVGGEGPPLSGSVVTSSPHCNVAVEYLAETKGLMFAVEHRYYGCHNSSACPYSESDSHPLQWLSSRQALEDLATFHAHAVAAYNLTHPGNKWVSFGGSYPGMLAGWFRVLYPELVHASVSSSAPVHAKLDMTEYFDIASRAYSLPSVGGSDACEGNIRAGHKNIGQLFNTSVGRYELASLFDEVKARGAEWLDSRANQAAFAGNGVASFPSQGNDPQCKGFGCGISRICDVMAGGQKADTPVERLAELANGQRRAHEESATPADAPPVSRLHATLDYWGWQTCNEFGFYQTCEVGSQCFFTQGYNTLPTDDGFCQENWGITPPMIQASIDASNKHYGALRPDLAHNATRILYVNGNVDPWSGLSILKSPAPTLPILIVEGASHHAWTHPSTPADQPSVIKARALIREQVAEWLGQ